jgi:pilus assembly protein Flp/PilA
LDLPPLARRVAVFQTTVCFLTDESGQGLAEYALIVALVAIVAIASLRVLGNKASNTLSNAASRLS